MRQRGEGRMVMPGPQVGGGGKGGVEPPAAGSPHPSSFILPPSGCRAWLYLVWLSWQRQARARQMVWIALALLVLSTVVVALNTAAGRWTLSHWRFFGRGGPTYQEWLTRSEAVAEALPYPGPARSIL